MADVSLDDMAGVSLNVMAGVSLDVLADGMRRMASGSEIQWRKCSRLNCYTNLGTHMGRYKHSLRRFYYANRVSGLFN